MYAWIAILAALGGGLAILFDRADRRLVPWRGRN
jgi:ABC-type nitrate/sulfonate/bicarbonate transport system permease component